MPNQTPDDTAEFAGETTRILAAIEHMRSMFGERAVGEIVQALLEDTGRGQAELASQHAQGDFVHLARTAHRLKGSMRAIGARDLAKICEGLETAAVEHDAQQVEDRLARLQRVLADVQPCLLPFLASV